MGAKGARMASVETAEGGKIQDRVHVGRVLVLELHVSRLLRAVTAAGRPEKRGRRPERETGRKGNGRESMGWGGG